MLNAADWMADFLTRVEELFGERIRFVGLQGSYGRDEADAESDIDPVILLDRWTMPDCRAYRAMLETMPEHEKICGFAGGADEIAHWDHADLFQLVWDTTPYRGSIAALVPSISREDAARAAHRGACDVYHALVHHSVHGDNPRLVPALLKQIVFVMQAQTYARSGAYLRRKDALLTAIAPEEQALLREAIRWKHAAKPTEEENHIAPMLLSYVQRVIHEEGH